MRKSVAIGIAGVTAVVVAAIRQVQRDNSLDTDPAPAPAPAPPRDPEPAPSQSLFTPSVNEKSTKAELYGIADDLANKYGCTVNAAFIKEAADVYEKRGRLKAE